MSEFKIPRLVFYLAILAATVFFINICNKLGISITFSAILSAFALILTSVGSMAALILKGILTFLKEYKEEQKNKDQELKESLRDISHKITLMNQVLLEHVEQSHSKDESDITKLKLSK